MSKILTSFTKLVTGEGTRLSYTYSEVADDGTIISQNNRGNFVVTDKALTTHLDAVGEYITEHKLTD